MPKIVLNDRVELVGAQPEPRFPEAVREAARAKDPVLTEA